MKNTTSNKSLPLSPEGVESFLASHWVEGIGPAYAKRLVEQFGADALRILSEEPSKAEVVPGLGESRVATPAPSRQKKTYTNETLALLL